MKVEGAKEAYKNWLKDYDEYIRQLGDKKKTEFSKEEKEWLKNYEFKYREALKNNYEDPRITQLIRLRCRDWMSLAMAVVEKYGEEGKEMVFARRYAAAVAVAEEIKTKYGTDPEALYRYYNDYLPWWEPIWDMYLGGLPKRFELKMKCQTGDYWKERLEEGTAPRELCKQWCDWDAWVPPLVNPKMKYKLVTWIPDGYPYCQHIWTLE